MGAPLRSAAVLALVLGAASCVQLSWERHDLHSEVAPEDDAALVEGEATLASCLERLGAPVLAWEVGAQRFALAWGWDKQREYGVSISVPLADTSSSASFNYDDVASRLHGLVLVFDEGGTLRLKRRGYLRDLAPEGARRPALVSEG
ncbi:MAG: hypothetical protein H6828_01900 [Planctomycetes bacterium]|nr:hypothetical protein [Planctomycetota bacterium]